MSPTSRVDFVLRLGIVAVLISVLTLAGYIYLVQLAAYFEKACAAIFGK